MCIRDRYETHGGYQRFFYELLNTDTDPVTITVYDVVNNELPRNPFEQEGWIVGGSRSSITAVEPWMLKLFDFLQDLDDHKAPTVGVCFGHQALAHALGGEVQRKHSWGLGSKPTQIHLKEPWMTPQMNAPVITFCHEDEVVGLPNKSKLIGSAENCAIAMFTKEDHIFRCNHILNSQMFLLEISTTTGDSPSTHQPLKQLTIP